MDSKKLYENNLNRSYRMTIVRVVSNLTTAITDMRKENVVDLVVPKVKTIIDQCTQFRDADPDERVTLLPELLHTLAQMRDAVKIVHAPKTRGVLDKCIHQIKNLEDEMVEHMHGRC